VKEFAVNQIENVIGFATGLAKDAVSEIEQIDGKDGKKFGDNKYYVHAKNIGTGALHVVGGVWTGLIDAFGSVMHGVGNATHEVVEHKYGKNMGDAVGEGIEIVGDGGEIFFAWSDGMKKAVHDNTHVSSIGGQKEKEKCAAPPKSGPVNNLFG